MFADKISPPTHGPAGRSPCWRTTAARTTCAWAGPPAGHRARARVPAPAGRTAPRGPGFRALPAPAQPVDRRPRGDPAAGHGVRLVPARPEPRPSRGQIHPPPAPIHIRRTPRPRDCTQLPAPAGASKEGCMIKWAIIFAVIGLIAGLLGFTGMAGAAMGIAKFLFWAGIIIAVVLFILGFTIFKKVT